MNENIIYQHKEILLIFEFLLNKISDHIKYEESILDERNKSKQNNHINIDKDLEQHKKYHQQLIKTIENLYKDFEMHIVTMDIKHMHKL
jgi:hemerythrin